MKRTALTLIASATLCAGLATAQECKTNFTKDGGFMKGAFFETHATFPSVPPSRAFTAVYRDIVKGGYTINDSNADVGIISAQQGVTGSGKTTPLNAVIEPAGAGSKVSLTFRTTGGLAVKATHVQTEFCRLVSNV